MTERKNHTGKRKPNQSLLKEIFGGQDISSERQQPSAAHNLFSNFRLIETPTNLQDLTK